MNMSATLKGNNVIANCSGCDGAKTSYEYKDTDDGRVFGLVNDNVAHKIMGEDGREHKGKQRIFRLLRCSTCGRAGMVQLSKDNYGVTYLMDFYPHSTNVLEIPKGTPKDIVSEFREAESDASHGNFRSAGAMLRSTIEKVLSKHGYVEFHLSKNIQNALKEGLITRVLKNKTVEVVKSLGDTVLHKEWRQIKESEYEEAHQYTKQIIEEFFSDPKEVLKLLMDVGRLDANGHIVVKLTEDEALKRAKKILDEIEKRLIKEQRMIKKKTTSPKP